MDYDCTGTCETVGCSDPLDHHPLKTPEELVYFDNEYGVFECRNCYGPVSTNFTDADSLAPRRVAFNFRRTTGGMGGEGMFESNVKTQRVNLISDTECWPDDDAADCTRQILLPYGSIIKRIHGHVPATPSSGSLISYRVGLCPYDSLACDSDGTVLVESVTQEARFAFTFNAEDQHVEVTDYADRWIRLWATGSDTQIQSGGYCIVEYY